jgi:hypothetical protein
MSDGASPSTPTQQDLYYEDDFDASSPSSPSRSGSESPVASSSHDASTGTPAVSEVELLLSRMGKLLHVLSLPREKRREVIAAEVEKKQRPASAPARASAFTPIKRRPGTAFSFQPLLSPGSVKMMEGKYRPLSARTEEAAKRREEWRERQARENLERLMEPAKMSERSRALTPTIPGSTVAGRHGELVKARDEEIKRRAEELYSFSHSPTLGAKTTEIAASLGNPPLFTRVDQIVEAHETLVEEMADKYYKEICPFSPAVNKHSLELVPADRLPFFDRLEEMDKEHEEIMERLRTEKYPLPRASPTLTKKTIEIAERMKAEGRRTPVIQL